jgi:hypothetical protein
MKPSHILGALLTLAFLTLLGITEVPGAAAIQPISIPGTTIADLDSTSYLPLVFNNNPLLYFDNFSDPDSGWPISDSGNVKLSYQEGEYEILIREQNYWGGAVPPLDDIAGYSVNADMRFQTGSGGFYGLIFDREDWDQFYIYVISPYGQVFGVLRHDPAAWVVLIPFAVSPSINTGSTANHLRVDRAGDQITVYVNDQLLTSISDDAYSGISNEVGLFAQSSTQVPVAMRFDNFTVSHLEVTSGRTTTPLLEGPHDRAADGPDPFIWNPD